MVNDKMIKW